MLYLINEVYVFFSRANAALTLRAPLKRSPDTASSEMRFGIGLSICEYGRMCWAVNNLYCVRIVSGGGCVRRVCVCVCNGFRVPFFGDDDAGQTHSERKTSIVNRHYIEPIHCECVTTCFNRQIVCNKLSTRFALNDKILLLCFYDSTKCVRQSAYKQKAMRKASLDGIALNEVVDTIQFQNMEHYCLAKNWSNLRWFCTRKATCHRK